jgi:hypothetical protein
MDSTAHVARDCQQWLADVLRGDGRVPTAPAIAPAELVAVAQAEGVRALVAERLRMLPAGDPLREAFAHASRELAVMAMLHEAETRRVLAVLETAALPVLLLKGSALAWWLYPAPYLRECSDIDLLLGSRDAVDEAARLFAGHGYDRGYFQGDQAYELVCRRELSASLRIDLDLHWGLNNAPVFAQAFGFEELHAASIPLPAVAPNARGLAPAHALLHACMHRAINLYTGIGDNLKWLYDLHLLAQRLTPADWESVMRLCRERDLGGVCVAGLDAAAVFFGDAAPADVLQALRASDAGVDGRRLQDWRYMHRMNLRALPSLRARLSWLLRKLFPTVAHMREMYGADKGVMGLLVERARQLVRKSH